jgi:hypothetical protein
VLAPRPSLRCCFHPGLLQCQPCLTVAPPPSPSPPASIAAAILVMQAIGARSAGLGPVHPRAPLPAGYPIRIARVRRRL